MSRVAKASTPVAKVSAPTWSGRSWSWLLAFSLLGLVAAASSSYVHVQLLRNPGYTSFCDVSATVSCTQAYLSPYGSVAGIPVAVLGVVFFAAALILLVAWRMAKPGTADNVPGYLFALSTLGLAIVLYLGYAAFFVLHSVCVLCVLTYVAVIGVFLISGSATPFPMLTLPGRAARDLRTVAASPLALLVSVLFLGGVASALTLFAWTEATPQAPAAAAAQIPAISDDKRSEVERWFDNEPRVSVPVEAAAGAIVAIVKFNDYQCPPCRQTYDMYKPIKAKYDAQAPGKIKFVTVDFPLDPECNANAPNGGHSAACEAAVAVRLARPLNKVDQLEEWLFANQPNLSPASVRQAARDVAGITDYEAKYAATLNQVKADTALGGLLEVRSTPTFFINGVRVVGGLPPQYLDTIIAHELKKAGS